MEVRSKLLIVEDDVDVAEMLDAFFRIQGYEVNVAHLGEDGIHNCQEAHPDIVLLDIHLPDINGYEVARRLKANRNTMEIPVIFLTEQGELTDRLEGLALGAVDYLLKPFDLQELSLRVKNVLNRAHQPSMSNPITGLPDTMIVDERLRECLLRSDWAIIVISIHHFTTFRATYGFVAADDVLRAVSVILLNIIKQTGGWDDFIGHLDLSDFLLITKSDRLGILHDEFQTHLSQSLDFFYPIRDREINSPSGQRLSVGISIHHSAEIRSSSLEHLKETLMGKK